MAWEQREMPETVEDKAAFWFARRRDSKLSVADQQAFETWHDEAPAHATAYARLQESWDDLAAAAIDDDIMAMREAALAMGPEKPERGWVKYAALAASVLLMAGGVALWPGLGLRERFASLFEQDVPPLYATQIGERSAISLADGSVMTLNTDSQVRVNYSSGERSVIMLKGQALFDVVKDATRPFVVKAGGREITVLGTSFDVRVKGTGALTVTLVDGKVAIAEPDVDALELNPGEQYIASEARAPQVRLANVERITSWQSGRLIFDGEPLGDAIEEINRYSVKKLIVKDERLNQLQVSGVFKTGASDRFVAAVSAYFPVDAVEESGNITLIWRDKNGQ